jgi:hypothetical protein
MGIEQAGWRPDPTGRHELRYWDGTTWTDHVSDQGAQSTDADLSPAAPDAVIAPPPAAPARAKRKGPSGCLWAAIIVGALAVVVIVVVVLAIGKAADTLSKEHARHAITHQQFDAVPLGVTRAQLEGQLGKSPENAQSFSSTDLAGKTTNSSCIYYNDDAESFGAAVFQFCFDGDTLQTKNSYG